MEENILEEAPQFKLYKDFAVRVGTFFGGPLVAGYLIAENFKNLGEKNKIKMTWIITIIATILIFVIAYFVSTSTSFPSYILPLVYTGIASALVQQMQGPRIKSHEADGGQFYSAWRALLVGAIGLAITIGALFLLFIALDLRVP